MAQFPASSIVSNPKRPRILRFLSWVYDSYTEENVALLGVQALYDGAIAHIRKMTFRDVQKYAEPSQEFTMAERLIIVDALNAFAPDSDNSSLSTDHLSREFREAVRDAGLSEGLFKERRYTTEQALFLREAAHLAADNYDIDRLLKKIPDSNPTLLTEWIAVAVENTSYCYPDVGGEEEVFNSVAVQQLGEMAHQASLDL